MKRVACSLAAALAQSAVCCRVLEAQVSFFQIRYLNSFTVPHLSPLDRSQGVISYGFNFLF